MLAMTEIRNEIINSKKYTPFLLPDWVRQRLILYHRGGNATISHSISVGKREYLKMSMAYAIMPVGKKQ